MPYHLVHMSEVLWPAPPGKALAAARADLRALPAGAWVISDDPGVVWRAGRRTPTTWSTRRSSGSSLGRLTATVRWFGRGRRPACVPCWSGRTASATWRRCPALLEDRGYRATARYGGPKVLLRPGHMHTLRRVRGRLRT